MPNQFFKNTIESKFIKSLLYHSYLPNVKPVSTGDYIVQGNSYIYLTSIVKCTKSGFVNGTPLAQYKKVGSYLYGQFHNNVDHRFMSSYNYYDSETHSRLGDYLRLIYKIYDVNLLPFYNCFNGSYMHGFYFTKSTLDNGYDIVHINKDVYYYKQKKDIKIFQIPIQLNRVYTVAYTCTTSFVMQPVIWKNSYLVDVKTSQGVQLNNALRKLQKVVSSSHFNQPFLFNSFTYNLTDSQQKLLEKYQKDLYLAIQVPISNQSSMVVLQGQYTDSTGNLIVNYDDKTIQYQYNQYQDVIVPNTLSNLSLLSMNDGEQHPYSDKLIENLLLNQVNSIQDISNNISLYQQKFRKALQNISKEKTIRYLIIYQPPVDEYGKTVVAGKQGWIALYVKNGQPKKVYVYTKDNAWVQYTEQLQKFLPDQTLSSKKSANGIWNNYLKLKLYKQYMMVQDKKYKKIDINGNIDKNIENWLIMRGDEKQWHQDSQ